MASVANAPKRLSKAQKAALADWLADVYRQSQRFADMLDPGLTHRSDIANKLDGICAQAKTAHFYLTGVHPKES